MRAASICVLAATVAFQFNCGGDDRITEFTFQARLFPIPRGATVTIDGTTVSDSDGELILDRMYPDYTMARADTIDIEVVDEGRRVADRGDREHRRVVVGADADERVVGSDIVDPVRNRFADRVARTSRRRARGYSCSSSVTQTPDPRGSLGRRGARAPERVPGARLRGVADHHPCAEPSRRHPCAHPRALPFGRGSPC